jgi:hypothetical protein
MRTGGEGSAHSRGEAAKAPGELKSFCRKKIQRDFAPAGWLCGQVAGIFSCVPSALS